MTLWDQKSWRDVTTISDQITDQAAYLAKRLKGGVGACTPSEVLAILDDMEKLVELARCPAEWAGD